MARAAPRMTTSLPVLLTTTSHDAQPPSTYFYFLQLHDIKEGNPLLIFGFKLQTHNFPDMDALPAQKF